jgi:pimeloyl-ACP methyl ester carboxylesterase
VRLRDNVLARQTLEGELMTCLREGTVGLPDGRRLGYGEYGKRGGKPVLLFHGSPGGRQFDLGKAVAKAGCWLFVLERPGIGLSDPKAGRRVLDWPIDVEAFVNHFGFDRFAVVGFSAGAPYALACGYALADRVPVVGLVCGYLAFADDPTLDNLADVTDRITRYRADPDAVRTELRKENTELANAWAADPDGFFRSLFGPMADGLPPFWLSMMSSAYGGPIDTDDNALAYEPMGFNVEDVSVRVHAWYGDQDPLLAAAQELVRRRPSTILTVYPGEGHFLAPQHRTDYLAALTDW